MEPPTPWTPLASASVPISRTTYCDLMFSRFKFVSNELERLVNHSFNVPAFLAMCVTHQQRYKNITCITHIDNNEKDE